MPQAPDVEAGNGLGEAAPELTANTDSCFSSSTLAQDGHEGD
jgi:hypothetical protein